MAKKRFFRFLKWFFGIIIGLSLLITGSIYYFKDEIIAVVLDEVNSNLKAKVEVEKIDIAFWSSFPNLSVDFNHVFVPDAYPDTTYTDTLFYSDKIRLRFNPMDIWREDYRLKQIDIHPGKLYLKVNEKGDVNYDILKEKEDTIETKFEFDLQNVVIKNLQFSYENKQINHRYATDLINTNLEGHFSEKLFTIQANSEQLIRQTRSGKVNFVSDKKANMDISIEVDQEKGTLKIPLTTIYIEDLPFQFSGFLSPENMKFTIESKRLALTDVVKHFTVNGVEQVKNYSGEGNVNFLLTISDNRLDNTNIEIDCQFDVQKGKLLEPSQNIQISNLFLGGKYSNNNGIGNDYLVLNYIRFTSPTGPFEGKLKISEFDAPKLEGIAVGDIDLAPLHVLFPFKNIEKIGGIVNTNVDFSVKIKPQSTIEIKRCEGSINFQNNYFQLVDDKRYFHSINGATFLKNNDVGIENLSLKLGKSDLQLNGMFSNVVSFFKAENNLIADLSVSSTAIVLEDLGTTSKTQQVQTNAPRTYILPQQINGKLQLSIDKLSYANHVFKQIQGNLGLDKRELKFNDIKFKTSGATIDGSVKIQEIAEEKFYTVSTLSSSNIQLKQLLKDWNNFSQEVIRDEHISGQAAANLYLEAPFDLRGGINMKQIKSSLSIKVVDGRLKGVEAFKEIVDNLKTPATKLALGANNITSFGNKLADLKFDVLENTLQINDGMVYIPTMKINSSALNIEAKGTHSFDNQIDYRFSFKLRDLKDKKTSEFGEVLDDNTGFIVYLRMYGSLNSPQFSWDKESKSEERKAYNEQEKQTVKSMLKSDFGLFKKDSTVQKFEEIKKPKEILEVQYGEDEKQSEEFEQEKKKKDSKFNNFLKKMKEEEKTKKVEIEFD